LRHISVAPHGSKDHAVAAADRLVAGASPAAAVQAVSNGFAVLQVLDGAGTVLAASPQLAGAPPLRPGQASVPEVVADQPDTLVGDARCWSSIGRSPPRPVCGWWWPAVRW
jgi:hypothetical protein